MNKRIRSMIDEIFADMKMTAENLALRDELMANAQARYEDAISNGVSEEEAFAEVAASLEDVKATLNNMEENKAEIESSDESKTEENELGGAIEKAFGALGDLGRQFVPQMGKLVKQADEATGGVMSEIGKAARKSASNVQKAAEDAIERLTRSVAEKSKEEETDVELNLTPEEMISRAKDIRAQAEIKQVAGDQEGARDLRRKAYELETRAEARRTEEAFIEAKEREEREKQLVSEEFDLEAEAEKIEEEIKETSNGIHIENASAGTVVINRFPMEMVKSIDIGVDADDIEILTGVGTDIEVIWESSGENNIQPEAKLEENTLSVRRKNPDVFKTFFSVFKKEGGKITLKIPGGYLPTYKISTTSGDIIGERIDAQSLKGNSTSGTIKLHFCPETPAKELKISTVSGNVEAIGSAEKTEIDSVSGNIVVEGTGKALCIKTVSGHITIDGAYDNWDIDTVSGEAVLNCKEGPKEKIHISSLSGSCHLTLPKNIPGFVVDTSGISGSVVNDFGPNRFGTCEFPIRYESMSGKLMIKKAEED